MRTAPLILATLLGRNVVSRITPFRGKLLRAGAVVAVASAITLAAAYGVSVITGVRWFWWVAPITLILESLAVLRARVAGKAAPASPSGLRIFRDAGPPIYLVSSVVGVGITVWGAFTQNAIAITLGAAFALAGQLWERSDETGFKQNDEPA